MYLAIRQVRSFKFPKREKMDALKGQWIEECGFTPVGNVKGNEWASGSKDAQVRQTTIARAPHRARCVYKSLQFYGDKAEYSHR